MEKLIKRPDHDPNNPYHYHNAEGEKVVITPKALLGSHLYQDGGPNGSRSKDHVTFGTYDEYGNIIPMYHLNQVNVGATQPYRTPEQQAQVTRERNMYFDAMRHFNYGNQDAEGLKETYTKYPELKSYLKRIGMSENDFMAAATGRDYETNSYERERTRQFNKDIQRAEAAKADKLMQAMSHQDPNDQKLAAVMTGLLVGVTGTGILGGLTSVGQGANALNTVGPKVLSAVKPGGSFWMNPLTKQMLVGTIASEGVNLGTNLVTGTAHNVAPNTFQRAESFPDLVGQSVEGVTGWNPNSTWWGNLLTGMTNPGWYRSPEKFIRNFNTAANGIKNTHRALTNNKYWYRLRRPFKKHSDYNAGVAYIPMMERISEKASSKEILNYLLSRGYTLGEDGYMRDPSGILYLKEPRLDESFPVKSTGTIKLDKNLELHPILFTSHTGEVVNGTQATQVFREVPKIDLRAKSNKAGYWIFGDKVRIIKRSPDWSPSNLKYTTTVNTNDIEIPLYNNPEFNAALAKEAEHVEKITGHPVVGSTKLISRGYFGGAPGDIEIVVPKRAIPEVLKRLKFEESRTTAGDTGITGNSPYVLKGKDPENIDINIVDDNGTILHQLYETLNPLEIERLYTKHALTQGNSAHPEKVTPSVSLKLPKTGELIVHEMNLDPQYTIQTVVDNLFKSNKPKHNARKLAALTLDNPEIINSVTKAIDNMYAQINGFEKFSVRYPSLKFNNPEENKEILKSINWKYGDIDKIALNELMMKNIVDDWYIKKVEATRSSDYQKMKGGETFENILNAKRQYGGGSASGGGGNSLLGSDRGGYLKSYTSYGVYHPIIDNPSTAKFSDVLSAMNREHEIWNNTELLNNAIKKVLHMPKFQKIAEENIPLTDDFTTHITNLVNKGLLTHEEANDFISLVSKELKVSGYRSGYSYINSGNEYFGIMRDPDAVSYRNIDNDGQYAANPAEFGQGTLASNASIHTYPVTKLVSRFDPALNMSEKELETAMTHRSLVRKAEAAQLKARNDAQARSDKRSQLLNEYYNKKLKMDNAKSPALLGFVSTSLGSPLVWLISSSNHNNKVYKFYSANRKELDKIIEKEIGKEPLYSREHPEVWNEWSDKQDEIVEREYKKRKKNDK